MADKISLTNLVNLTNQTTAVNAINANNQALITAIDNTLSRDGTPPNQMGSALDMNSNRILNLQSAISTSEPVTLSQMTAALVTNGNINTGLTGVPVSAAMQPVVNASTITIAQTDLKIPTPYIDATLYGVTADGSTDDTAALQAAVTAAAGREVFLPPGTIVLTSQVSYIVPVNAVSPNFNPGMKLRGCGPEKTFIDNRVSNNSCLYTAGISGTTYSYGGYIKDLTIKTTTNPVVSHGIEIYACYQHTVENVHVIGLSGDGMRVTNNSSDADASNIVVFRKCRFENCLNGLNCNFALGVVQTSFMRVEDSLFSGNTTGWRYIGLDGMLINGGFVINTTGLNIVSNSGSNAQFTSLNTSFENNGIAINANGLQGGEFIQTELAGSNAAFSSTQAVLLTGCSCVKFSGTRVRISSSPHTLWTFGTNSICNEICNSFYNNYDNAGQARYALTGSGLYGNRFDDSFDSVQVGRQNGILNITAANGANENLGIPIEGAAFFFAGITGSFNIGGLTNGYDGRRLTLFNTTGQVLTLNNEDSSSTAANRLRMDNSSNVTINNNGSCMFLYNANISRWMLVGHG